MPRQIFPTDADKSIVEWFLGGCSGPFTPGTHPNAEFGVLGIDQGKLTLGSTFVAWFDSAGALTVHGMDSWFGIYRIKVANLLLEVLGEPERRMVLEHEEDPVTHHLKHERVLFFDGRAIQSGEPIVIAGPLTVAAYRANRSA